METIGLRELNQNPSKAVARVRAGESLLVTDRGKPILRMVPEIEAEGLLRRMVSDGVVTAPGDAGLPDLIDDLAPDAVSLSEALISERDVERNGWR